MKFNTNVVSQIMKSWHLICYKGFIVVGLFIFKKVFLYRHKWKQCSSFLIIHLFEKVLIESVVFQTHLSWSSRMTIKLTETMYWRHSLSVIIALTNCFIKPSLICRGGNMIFFRLTIWSLTIFGIPTSRVSHKGHSFWFQCLSFFSLSCPTCR